MAFGKKNLKRGKKGMRSRRPRFARKRVMKAGVPERASCTEILPALTASSNQNYSSYNISLASCVRARDIAKGYQFYRIKRVTYVIKPELDTFISGGPTLPYLYYMIDRTKQFVNGFTLEQLLSMGAKPRRLDDKTLEFHYIPSVLTETYDATAGATPFVQYKLKPWLPTKDISQVGVWNPNTTDHLGVVWRVAQRLTGGQVVTYSIERRVEIEFKKPSTSTAPAGEEDVPREVDPDVLPQIIG